MKIKKFNEQSEDDFDQSKDDFEILKKSTIQQIKKLYEEYEDFVNDVSPKHWRTTGHHFTELRKMLSDIEQFTPVTKTEKENDYVKKARAGEKY